MTGETDGDEGEVVGVAGGVAGRDVARALLDIPGTCACVWCVCARGHDFWG